ncbi:hypothetical protein L2E82_31281 [Cichorium intybus]|uniref:Uncharacterized protein n=1 Tax=Cichorium intybus TaxID=13427 RepID=A0ACB9D2L4_CICIN|nr:hypothetical protein L2E82_31281 [Cichorium intybus]
MERMDCMMIQERILQPIKVYRQSLVPLVPLADEEQSIDCRSLFFLFYASVSIPIRLARNRQRNRMLNVPISFRLDDHIFKPK